MGVLAWLFNTTLGRYALVALISVAVAGLSWWAFSDHYYDKGVAACEAAHLKAVNAANVAQAEENDKKNTVSSEVANAATEAAEDVVSTIDTASVKTVEVIRYVYRDRPTTAPVTLNSCARSVDPGVQKRLDQAVDRANEAGGPL